MPLPPVLHEYHQRYRTTAFLVLHRDTVIYERYWRDGHPDSPSNSFSVAKSVVALLTAKAVEQGILDWDDSVGQWLPWARGTDLASIRVRHLVTMTSGLNWFEHYWLPITHTSEAYYGSDLQKLMLKLRRIDTPGTRFIYKSGDTQLLGFVLAAATGKSLSQLLEEWFWQPMGAADTAYWALDRPDGMEKAYCCLFATARDFARLGLLLLHHGRGPRDTLLDASLLDTLLVPVGVPDRHGHPTTYYGKGFWLLDSAGYEGIFYARGILGQYIIVMPAEQVVVVRLGHWRMQRIRHHPGGVFLMVDAMRQMLHQDR